MNTDLSSISEFEISRLFVAAKKGDIEAIEDAIKSNSEIVNVAQDDGTTLLGRASHCGHKNLVQILLDYKADSNSVSTDGLTPLNTACFKGLTEIVQLLVKYGADINKASDEGWTPLHNSLSEGHSKITQLLIEHQANINSPNQNGYTPLCLAKIYRKGKDKRDIHLITQKDAYAKSYAQEFILRKLIAHAWHIDGESSLSPTGNVKDMKVFPYTGLYPECIWRIFWKGTNVYQKEHPKQISLHSLLDILEYTKDQHKRTYSEILSRYNSDKPIFLSSGFLEHHVVIFILENYLILCNRGFKNRHCYEVHRFNKNLLDKRIIKELCRLKDLSPEDYAKCLFEKLPKELNFKKKQNEINLEKALNTHVKDQTIGNCAWANDEAAVFAFFVLIRIHKVENPDHLNFSDIQNIVRRQFREFIKWLNYQKSFLLQKYLRVISKPSHIHPPDSNLINGVKIISQHNKGLNAILNSIEEKAKTLQLLNDFDSSTIQGIGD